MFFMHLLFLFLGFIIFNEVCPDWDEKLIYKINKNSEKGAEKP